MDLAILDNQLVKAHLLDLLQTHQTEQDQVVEQVTHVPVVGIQELPDKDLEAVLLAVLLHMPVAVAAALVAQEGLGKVVMLEKVAKVDK